MDDVLEFARRYLAEEYEIGRAAWLIADEKEYRARLKQYESMYAKPGGLGLGRPTTQTEEQRKAGAERLKLSKDEPGILFQVKEYEHPKLGQIYRIYTSGHIHPRHKATMYLSGHIVQRTKDGLKIVARYQFCDTCHATGVFEGKKCPDCEGQGWIYRGGEKVGDPGKLVAVRKVQAPTDEASLEEYNRDEKSKKPSKK
ncbi:MAG TPA: hypothetical protein VFF06_32795 [Polyangia bacterium]|nr:hypothetical protein [Polyangia bacterium]